MNREELFNFIKNRLEDPNFEGCYYSYLGNDLYLVFSKDYNGNGDLDCKVAFNCDDLQYDYECDWEMPENKNGDLIGQDWCDILECGYTAEQLTNEVINTYNSIIKCGWKKPD